MNRKLFRIAEADNVAVALSPVAAGESIDGGNAVYALQDIPQGHKAALRGIPAGAPVIKYGVPIGHALRDIAAGEWVHTHNMATNLSGRAEYRYSPAEDPSWKDWKDRFSGRAESRDPKGKAGTNAAGARTFLGYRRADGRVGIRNEIWIIPTVGCVNDVARRLAEEVRGTFGGVCAFEHPFGCSQTGADHAQTKKLLAALARHPNAGGVLIVSLGCENCTHEEFTEELGSFDPDRVKFLICQQEPDEIAAGKALLAELAAYVSGFVREEIPVSELVVGFKCGGSDGLSGITANPLVGRFGDSLIRRGGTAILTEVPEMFGAEELLLGRCVSREVFDKAAAMLDGFREYYLSHGEEVYENPSPGNKAGGITTLEDKSCGCIQKGGTAPVTDVIGYGKTVREKGLTLLCGPGNDLVSATALAAAGAHLILFTTGRGTPFGAPVPTFKIATNTALAERKRNWIDFNAGVIADGGRPAGSRSAAGAADADEGFSRDGGQLSETGGSGADRFAEAAEELLRQVIAVASGEKTRSEMNGYRGIAIWKDGVTL